jgi:hypothetical protein
MIIKIITAVITLLSNNKLVINKMKYRVILNEKL